MRGKLSSIMVGMLILLSMFVGLDSVMEVTFIGKATSTPVADAGPDQTVYAGITVQFDGSGSFDPDTYWESEIVNPPSWAAHPSITINESDIPQIIYSGDNNKELQYARLIEGIWYNESSPNNGGGDISSAVDTNDTTHISLYDPYNDLLKYGKRIKDSWQFEIVDSIETNVGIMSSLALDSSDSPHISYWDEPNGDLKYARKNGTTWINETIDTWGNVGKGNSIAIGSNDHPHISYYSSTFNELKYVRWNGSEWIREIVDYNISFGGDTSLDLDANDMPHISYYDNTNDDLKYAKKNIDKWINQTVDSEGDVGIWNDLKVDGAGNPHICYRDNTHFNLKYARLHYNEWTNDTIGLGNDVGRHTSMVFDSFGNPHICHSSWGPTDVYYTRKINNIISFEWEFGDNSTNDTGMFPKHVYYSPGIYNVTLTVTDRDGNIDTDTCIINVRPPIYLHEGWNLVSIPLIQSDTNLGMVLSSISGSYDAVQWYNTKDTLDPWKHNHILKPQNMNDLNELDHRMGFWIHVIKPGGTILYLDGLDPNIPQFINITRGWNMVGYPSLTNYNRTEGLNNLSFGVHVDSIWTYNAQLQKWEEIDESDYFELGMGYWIYANEECVWEVEP